MGAGGLPLSLPTLKPTTNQRPAHHHHHAARHELASIERCVWLGRLPGGRWQGTRTALASTPPKARICNDYAYRVIRNEMKIDLGGILESVQEQLKKAGVVVDVSAGVGKDVDADAKVKVVCVTPDLSESVREMGETLRDQVVMVRVDEATSEALDAWVETGAVKSRSEAAALFIREGLRVRADELDKLRDALRDVEEARERLRSRVKDVFGRDDGVSDE